MRFRGRIDPGKQCGCLHRPAFFFGKCRIFPCHTGRFFFPSGNRSGALPPATEAFFPPGLTVSEERFAKPEVGWAKTGTVFFTVPAGTKGGEGTTTFSSLHPARTNRMSSTNEKLNAGVREKMLLKLFTGRLTGKWYTLAHDRRYYTHRHGRVKMKNSSVSLSGSTM